MTSRERIGKLLRGEPTDRIPNGLMGCETASVHMLAYDKLKKLFGVKNKRNRLFSFMFNAVPEIEFLEKAGCDIIPLSTKLSPAPFWKDIEKNWKDESLFGITVQVPNSYHFRHNADGSTDWTDVGWHCPAGGLYFDEGLALKNFMFLKLKFGCCVVRMWKFPLSEHYNLFMPIRNSDGKSILNFMK